MTWLFCYDIENDSIRQKLARYLEKSGWERLQKSVFANSMEIKEFNRYFKKIKDRFGAKLETTDKIYTWPVNDNQFANAAIIGQSYDAKWIQNGYVIMYVGEENLLK
ncbi:MAG: CRISPR-associated endonuclease Cas2 [Bacteroidota bacterium]|nr:CRISPR-associated endonuclease Cas2 [Bacteroidota bacterium]